MGGHGLLTMCVTAPKLHHHAKTGAIMHFPDIVGVTRNHFHFTQKNSMLTEYI